MIASKTQKTFSRAVEGSRGTIHWVNGYGSSRVEILDVGDDHLLVQKANERDGVDVLAVPLSAILYFRFADEDD